MSDDEPSRDINELLGDDNSDDDPVGQSPKPLKIPKKSRARMGELVEQRKLRERRMNEQTAQLRWDRTLQWLESLRDATENRDWVMLALLRDRKRLQWAMDRQAAPLDQPRVTLLLLQNLHVASGSSLPSWTRALFALITESEFVQRTAKVWFIEQGTKLEVRKEFSFNSARDKLDTCWLFKLIQLLGRWGNRLASVDTACAPVAEASAAMMDAMRNSLLETCFKPGSEELQHECELQHQRLTQLPRGNPRGNRFSQSPRAATLAANFPSSVVFQSPPQSGRSTDTNVPVERHPSTPSQWKESTATAAVAGGDAAAATWKTPPPRIRIPEASSSAGGSAGSPREPESTTQLLEKEMLAFRSDPPFPPLEMIVAEQKARRAETKAAEAAAEWNPHLKGSAARAGAGKERLEDAHGLLGVCHQLRYRSTEHYLATQYWLLREDFLRPMREAIAVIHRYGLEKARDRNDGAALEGVRAYSNCLLGARVPIPQRGVICQRLHIVGEQQKARCKSLVYGSLVAISAQRDGFKTQADWALVVNSDEALLEQGIVDVAFDYSQGAHQFGAAALTPAPTSNSPRSAAASACMLDAYSPRAHFAGAAPNGTTSPRASNGYTGSNTSSNTSSSVVAVAPARLKGKRLLILESLAYYEGCRHVLRALQRMPVHAKVPFGDYLIGGQRDVRLPPYLSQQEGPGQSPVQYDLQCLTRVNPRAAHAAPSAVPSAVPSVAPSSSSSFISSSRAGGGGYDSEEAESSQSNNSQVQQRQHDQRAAALGSIYESEQDIPLEVAVTQPW
jgi:hypothetical protein